MQGAPCVCGGRGRGRADRECQFRDNRTDQVGGEEAACWDL